MIAVFVICCICSLSFMFIRCHTFPMQPAPPITSSRIDLLAVCDAMWRTTCQQHPASSHPVMHSCNHLQADRYWVYACDLWLSVLSFSAKHCSEKHDTSSFEKAEEKLNIASESGSLPWAFRCSCAWKLSTPQPWSCLPPGSGTLPPVHGTPGIHQVSTRHPTAAARPRQLPSSPAERRLRAPFWQGLDGWGSRNPMKSGEYKLYQAISGYIYKTSITSFWKKKPSNTEQRNVLRIAADRCVAVSCSLLRASADTDSSWQQLTATDSSSQDITSCNAKDGRCGDVRIKDDLHIHTSFPQREYQYHWTSLNIIKYHWISLNITKVKNGMLPLTLELCEFTGLSNFPTASRVDLASCGTVTSEPPARPKTSHRTCVLKLRTYSILDSTDSASTFVLCQIIDNPW